MFFELTSYKYFNGEILFGAGVSVGQQFFSRAEMVVVGLHGRWMSGIDYMGKSYKKQVVTAAFGSLV